MRTPTRRIGPAPLSAVSPQAPRTTSAIDRSVPTDRCYGCRAALSRAVQITLTSNDSVPYGYRIHRLPRGDVVAELQGFFHPQTASGQSSLLPPPPWFYSGDLLTVEYRTDPARVADLLPAPLELAPDDPGAVAFIWADWQSCSSSRDELLDPVRAQYKEAFVVV